MYRDEIYYIYSFTFWESVTLAFLAEPRPLVASDACVPSGTTSPSMPVFLAEPHRPPMLVFLAEPHHPLHTPPKPHLAEPDHPLHTAIRCNLSVSQVSDHTIRKSV